MDFQTQSSLQLKGEGGMDSSNSIHLSPEWTPNLVQLIHFSNVETEAQRGEVSTPKVAQPVKVRTRP